MRSVCELDRLINEEKFDVEAAKKMKEEDLK